MRQDDFKKILIIKLRYIGDVLLSTPVAANLRRHFPDAHITMVVNSGTDEVLRYNPHINRVIPIDRSEVKGNFIERIQSSFRIVTQIRREQFDLVIDLTDGDRGAILSYLSNARMRVGYNAEGRVRGRLYTTIVHPSSPDLHNVEYQLEVIRALGLPIKTKDLVLHWGIEDDLFVTDWLTKNGLAKHHFVTIHPGGRWWFKQWPLERFATLAESLRERFGLEVVFLGGEKEREGIKEIAHYLGRSFYAAEGLTLLQLAALIQRSCLFIGNDNGPMHIAAAVGTPVIALFGSSDPKVWGPWEKGSTIIYKGVSCSPCTHTGCNMGEFNCMRQITVSEVIAGVEKQLPRSHSPAGSYRG